MERNKTLEKSTILVAALSSFMGPFIISSVNVALPAIQQEFSADAVQLSWVATALLLAVAVVLIPMGKLGDIYGRKKIFTFGLAVFTLSSLSGAFSVSMPMLIGVRVFQGFGAAMFVTTGMAILTSVFPPKRRGRAIGIYVTAVYIGLSVGPFAGGFLTQYLGWRSIFGVVVPFGVLSVWITLKYLKDEWADAKGEKFDLTGSILYALSVFLLVYGASLIPKHIAVYLILTGLVMTMIFVRVELYTPQPVFEMRLFSGNRLFAFSSLAALINYAATFAVTFLLSLYLQYIKGLDPRTAGIILMAQPVIMAFFSPMAGRLSDQIEPRFISSAGMALIAAGLLIFSGVGAKTEILYIVATLMMLGFGFALFSSPNMNAIMGSVKKKYLGVASGTVAAMRLIGQMASMAIAMVIFAIFIGREQITPSNYELFLKSVKCSFLIFSFLCVIGIFFSFSRGELRNKNTK